MITKKQPVTGEVHIWAVPRQSYEISPESPELFTYEITQSSSHHWRNGAVKVSSHTINLEVPEGINLLERAIITLEEAKAERFRVYQQEAAEIQKQMDSLLLLSAPKVEVQSEEDLEYIDSNPEQSEYIDLPDPVDDIQF